jgi:hypothetical protein
MLAEFEDWTAGIAETTSLEALRGAVIAIEAADYISKILTIPYAKEPLLAALGGQPFSLKRELLLDIENLAKYAITPIFVFPGLHAGQNEKPFRSSEALAMNSERAWNSYERHDPEGAVAQFGEPFTQQRVYSALIGASNGGDEAPVCAEDIFRVMQNVLHEAEVTFMVAPYSAWAQLAYMIKLPNTVVNAIAGSSELFLFDVDQVITSLSPKEGEFVYVRKQSCLAELGITSDMFLDACLLAGSSILQTIPHLEAGSTHKAKIRAAVALLNAHGRKGNNVCLAFQEDAQSRAVNYTDKYRRSLLSVKHHVVLTMEGRVQPIKVEEAPGDIHEFIGQRLPDEIYYYLSRGVIGARVLNWRASAEIIEKTPLDGGETEEYRRLVRDVLTPIRATTLSVLSHSLHRFYQHKDVTLRCWFNRDHSTIIHLRNEPDPKPTLNSWNTHLENFKQTSNFEGVGPLGYLIRSLKDKDFAASTVTPKVLGKPLNSKTWILLNTLGRFLQLRHYVEPKHCFTPWGNALHAAFAALNGRGDLEQPVFLAIEMARLGQLTHKQLFPNTSGAPTRGSNEDKRNCLLVARVACLGTLNHQAIGYTGPLNRQLRSYHSFIDVVRQTLRDLAEVCLTTLLLNGDADRGQPDLTDLGLSLPFTTGTNCALGIAVLSYLDDIAGHPDPTSPEAKSLDRERGPKEWFPTSINLAEDVRSAFVLWDAVYAGAQAAGDLWEDKSVWDEANAWLQQRR